MFFCVWRYTAPLQQLDANVYLTYIAGWGGRRPNNRTHKHTLTEGAGVFSSDAVVVNTRLWTSLTKGECLRPLHLMRKPPPPQSRPTGIQICYIT